MKTVYPLVRVTSGFMLGLVLGRYLSPTPRPDIILAGIGLLAISLLFLFRRSLSLSGRRALLWLGIFALAAAAGAGRYSLAGRVPAGDISRYVTDRPRAITGIVAVEPVFQRHSVRFVLDCRRVGTEEGEVPVTGRLQVTFHGQVRATEEVLQTGNLLRVTAKIILPPEATNPGEISPGPGWPPVRSTRRVAFIAPTTSSCFGRPGVSLRSVWL